MVAAYVPIVDIEVWNFHRAVASTVSTWLRVCWKCVMSFFRSVRNWKCCLLVWWLDRFTAGMNRRNSSEIIMESLICLSEFVWVWVRIPLPVIFIVELTKWISRWFGNTNIHSLVLMGIHVSAIVDEWMRHSSWTVALQPRIQGGWRGFSPPKREVEKRKN